MSPKNTTSQKRASTTRATVPPAKKTVDSPVKGGKASAKGSAQATPAVKVAGKTAAKASAKKTAVKKSAVKKSAGSASAVKAVAVKQAAVKKGTVKAASVKQAGPNKTATKTKRSPARQAPVQPAAAKQPPKQTAVKRTTANKSAGQRAEKGRLKTPAVPPKSSAKTASKTASMSAASPAEKSMARTAAKTTGKAARHTTAKASKPTQHAPESSAAASSKRAAADRSGTTTTASRPLKKANVPAGGDYARFRELLLAFRHRLVGDVSMMSREALGGSDGAADNHAPIHPAEVGTHSFEQEFTLNLLSSDGERLERIDAALEKIGDGTYGACEECGCRIPRARLEVIPDTPYCVKCAARLEV